MEKLDYETSEENKEKEEMKNNFQFLQGTMSEMNGNISEMKGGFIELAKEVKESNLLLLQTLQALNKVIEKKFSVVYKNKTILSK